MNRAPIHVHLRLFMCTCDAAQHGWPQEPLGGGSSVWAASVHPAPAVQGGQAQPILRSVRVSMPCADSAIAGLRALCLQYLPWCYLLCDVVCDSSGCLW